MDVRTITIADTKSQKRYDIQTSATTLGELMMEMDRQGIDYSGMSFTEGITRTALLSPESALPSNVMFKGERTNNLIMLMTNTSKKIESGSYGTRADAYAIIKEQGLPLKSFIAEKTEANYTNVSTDTLWELIDEFMGSDDAKNTVEPAYNDEKDVEEKNDDEISDLAYSVVDVLDKCFPALTTADLEYVEEFISKELQDRKAKESFVSDKELQDMIANL